MKSCALCFANSLAPVRCRACGNYFCGADQQNAWPHFLQHAQLTRHEQFDVPERGVVHIGSADLAELCAHLRSYRASGARTQSQGQQYGQGYQESQGFAQQQAFGYNQGQVQAQAPKSSYEWGQVQVQGQRQEYAYDQSNDQFQAPQQPQFQPQRQAQFQPQAQPQAQFQAQYQPQHLFQPQQADPRSQTTPTTKTPPGGKTSLFGGKLAGDFANFKQNQQIVQQPAFSQPPTFQQMSQGLPNAMASNQSENAFAGQTAFSNDSRVRSAQLGAQSQQEYVFGVQQQYGQVQFGAAGVAQAQQRYAERATPQVFQPPNSQFNAQAQARAPQSNQFQRGVEERQQERAGESNGFLYQGQPINAQVSLQQGANTLKQNQAPFSQVYDVQAQQQVFSQPDQRNSADATVSVTRSFASQQASKPEYSNFAQLARQNANEEVLTAAFPPLSNVNGQRQTSVVLEVPEVPQMQASTAPQQYSQKSVQGQQDFALPQDQPLQFAQASNTPEQSSQIALFARQPLVAENMALIGQNTNSKKPFERLLRIPTAFNENGDTASLPYGKKLICHLFSNEFKNHKVTYANGRYQCEQQSTYFQMQRYLAESVPYYYYMKPALVLEYYAQGSRWSLGKYPVASDSVIFAQVYGKDRAKDAVYNYALIDLARNGISAAKIAAASPSVSFEIASTKRILHLNGVVVASKRYLQIELERQPFGQFIGVRLDQQQFLAEYGAELQFLTHGDQENAVFNVASNKFVAILETTVFEDKWDKCIKALKYVSDYASEVPNLAFMLGTPLNSKQPSDAAAKQRLPGLTEVNAAINDVQPTIQAMQQQGKFSAKQVEDYIRLLQNVLTASTALVQCNQHDNFALTAGLILRTLMSAYKKQGFILCATSTQQETDSLLAGAVSCGLDYYLACLNDAGEFQAVDYGSKTVVPIASAVMQKIQRGTYGGQQISTQANKKLADMLALGQVDACVCQEEYKLLYQYEMTLRPVIVASIVGINATLLKPFRFAATVIWDAAKLLEPECMLPVSYAPDHVVLLTVGPCRELQLHDPELLETNLQRSLFQRLVDLGVPVFYSGDLPQQQNFNMQGYQPAVAPLAQPWQAQGVPLVSAALAAPMAQRLVVVPHQAGQAQPAVPAAAIPPIAQMLPMPAMPQTAQTAPIPFVPPVPHAQPAQQPPAQLPNQLFQNAPAAAAGQFQAPNPQPFTAKPHKQVAPRPQANFLLAGLFKPQFPRAFWDVQAQDPPRDQLPRQFNFQEAQAIQNTVQFIIQQGVPAAKMAVFVPHQEQAELVDLLIEKFPAVAIKLLPAQTPFQRKAARANGQEKQQQQQQIKEPQAFQAQPQGKAAEIALAIVSCVSSNEPHPGLFADIAPALAAIKAQAKQLLIIGDAAYWAGQNNWAEVLGEFQERGALLKGSNLRTLKPFYLQAQPQGNEQAPQAPQVPQVDQLQIEQNAQQPVQALQNQPQTQQNGAEQQAERTQNAQNAQNALHAQNAQKAQPAQPAAQQPATKQPTVQQPTIKQPAVQQVKAQQMKAPAANPPATNPPAVNPQIAQQTQQTQQKQQKQQAQQPQALQQPQPQPQNGKIQAAQPAQTAQFVQPAQAAQLDQFEQPAQPAQPAQGDQPAQQKRPPQGVEPAAAAQNLVIQPPPPPQCPYCERAGPDYYLQCGHAYHLQCALDNYQKSQQCVICQTDYLDEITPFLFAAEDEVLEQQRLDNLGCPVCLEPMVDDKLVTRLACTHELHTECLNKMLGYQSSCPLCRKPIKRGMQLRAARE